MINVSNVSTANISNSASSWRSVSTLADSSPEDTQYVTFKLADYLIALPSQKILKIVATPPSDQGSLASIGLVQLGQHSIQILDLAKFFGLKEPSEESRQNLPFLVVFQDKAQELWGIALPEPPDLMKVPDYALRPVPPEKRLTQILQWVSHVVTYDLNSNRHTLLLLDLSAVLNIDWTEPTAKSISAPPLNLPVETGDETVRKSEMYA